MSISSLTNVVAGQSLLPISIAGGIPAQISYVFAPVSVANAVQSHTLIQAFPYAGSKLTGQAVMGQAQYTYSSGVLGNITFEITDITRTIVYLQGTINIGTTGTPISVPMTTVVAPLPTTACILCLCYTTSTGWNHPTDTVSGFLVNFN